MVDTKETKIELEDNNKPNPDDSSKVSLEEESISMNINQLEALRNKFYQNIAASNGKVFAIESYLVNNRDSNIKGSDPSLISYVVTSHNAMAVDFQSKPGFARINNSFDIPLVDRPFVSGGICYMYNKQAAEERALELIMDSRRIIQERASIYKAYLDSMDDIINKKKYIS
jgi:hypothetical protein